MGHCVRVYFASEAEKDAAFQAMIASDNVERIGQKVFKIIDPTSRSGNFLANEIDFIEIELEVKTRFLTAFMLDKLGGCQCVVKDSEDPEEMPGEPISGFFRWQG